MPRVLCTLPHASSRINGVTFAADRGQMISEEVSEEVAANFASIDGYQVVGAKPATPKDGEKRGPGRPKKEQAAADGADGAKDQVSDADQATDQDTGKDGAEGVEGDKDAGDQSKPAE